jgi:uncharacterized membrane protein
MADYIAQPVAATPRQSLVTLTHVLYAMHGFSVLMGVLSPAFIVTAFLFGWPSIIAVIVNYIKRDDVRGTYLDSHFSWQLRTFWYSVLWGAILLVCALTVIGLVVAWPGAIVLGIWIVYRITRGWMNLVSGKAMPMKS